MIGFYQWKTVILIVKTFSLQKGSSFLHFLSTVLHINSLGLQKIKPEIHILISLRTIIIC